MPVVGRVVDLPMTLPRLRSVKKLAMLRPFLRLLAERRLTNGAPKMIHDLVLENAHQPRPFRTAACEIFVGLQGGEESFLHGIFRGAIVAQTKHCIPEKIIAVVVQPTTGIRGFNGGLTLRLVHTNLQSWARR